MKNGFTLLEMMLVLLVMGIIAAIAIPNFMRGRLQANEANAVAALRTYATAQVTFQTGKQGRAKTNSLAGSTGYCDNFRNLHYGNPIAESVGYSFSIDANTNLALINQAFADAFGGPHLDGAAKVNSGIPKTAATDATAYAGYFFLEPSALSTPPAVPGGTAKTQFLHTFALHAVPANSSATGNNAFWVSLDSTVWQKGLKQDQDYAASLAEPTPSSPGFAGWTTM